MKREDTSLCVDGHMHRYKLMRKRKKERERTRKEARERERKRKNCCCFLTPNNLTTIANGLLSFSFELQAKRSINRMKQKHEWEIYLEQIKWVLKMFL